MPPPDPGGIQAFLLPLLSQKVDPACPSVDPSEWVSCQGFPPLPEGVGLELTVDHGDVREVWTAWRLADGRRMAMRAAEIFDGCGGSEWGAEAFSGPVFPRAVRRGDLQHFLVEGFLVAGGPWLQVEGGRSAVEVRTDLASRLDSRW